MVVETVDEMVASMVDLWERMWAVTRVGWKVAKMAESWVGLSGPPHQDWNSRWWVDGMVVRKVVLSVVGKDPR